MKKSVLQFGIASLSMAFAIVSCSKEEQQLPPIGGYNSADEVSSSNLVAYWNMDGNGNEKKTGATPANSKNATFVTGIKGQAVNFAAGYLAYNEISSLNSLPSATVSAWVNVKNNGSSPSCFFTMTRPNEWAGNINLMAETGWKQSAIDTLVVKGLVVTKVNGNDSWQDSRNEPSKGGDQAAKIAGNWAHLVITWDAASSLFKVYANGVKVSNPEWELRGAGAIGALNFTTPTKPVIGAWGTNLSGTPESWQVPMTGMVDEVRIWSKALSDADISSLYQLEKAGR